MLRSQRQHSWQMARSTVDAWVDDDDAASMSAALSCYTAFSQAPLLLIVIAVAGMLFGQEAVRGEIFDELRRLLAADAVATVEAVLANARHPAEGLVATLIGIGVLLVGAPRSSARCRGHWTGSGARTRNSSSPPT